MQIKKPMIKETVGALYYAFNDPEEGKDFDITKYLETIQSKVVKKIGTTENAESTVVRASGEDYITASQTSSVEQAVEVIAFDPEDLHKMRGDTIDTGGLILSGAPKVRPFFAFGKVVLKVGGAVEYVWYPKCQLVENTEDAETSEEKFKEQTDTITIKALAFDKAGNKSVRVNSETSKFPEGLTEELFFTKPISTPEELAALVTPGT